MTDRERRLAEFFGRLASIPVPTEDMSAKEARQFRKSVADEAKCEARGKTAGTRFEHAQAHKNRRLSGLDQVSARVRSELEREFLRHSSFVRDRAALFHDDDYEARFRQFAAEDLLPWLHEQVRKMMRDLFEVGYAPVHLSLPRIRLELKGSVLREVRYGVEPHEELGGDFLSILLLKPFPFGRCPVCARFFVRVRRQRYCSPPCTSRGVETARRGRRREYMRKYMANWRAKNRSKKKREER